MWKGSRSIYYMNNIPLFPNANMGVTSGVYADRATMTPDPPTYIDTIIELENRIREWRDRAVAGPDTPTYDGTTTVSLEATRAIDATSATAPEVTGWVTPIAPPTDYDQEMADSGARRMGYIEVGRNTLRRALNLPNDVNIVWVMGSARSDAVLIQLDSTRFPWTPEGGEIPRYPCRIADIGHHGLVCDLPELDTQMSINRGEMI